MSGTFQADPARQSASVSKMEEVGDRTGQAEGHFTDAYAPLAGWAGHDQFGIQAGGQVRQFVHTMTSALGALRSAAVAFPNAWKQSQHFVEQAQQGVNETINRAGAQQAASDFHGTSGKN